MLYRFEINIYYFMSTNVNVNKTHVIDKMTPKNVLNILTAAAWFKVYLKKKCRYQLFNSFYPTLHSLFKMAEHLACILESWIINNC